MTVDSRTRISHRASVLRGWDNYYERKYWNGHNNNARFGRGAGEESGRQKRKSPAAVATGLCGGDEGDRTPYLLNAIQEVTPQKPLINKHFPLVFGHNSDTLAAVSLPFQSRKKFENFWKSLQKSIDKSPKGWYNISVPRARAPEQIYRKEKRTWPSKRKRAATAQLPNSQSPPLSSRWSTACLL